MADTGLKSGMGANSMRPAAARAASTTVGMTCRKEGREVSKEAKNTPTAKRPWPKILSEQIQQMRECLTATPMTSKALVAQFKGKSTALQGVLDSLVMLGIVREEQGVYAMT